MSATRQYACDLIQAQGHETFTVRNSSIFKVLFPPPFTMGASKLVPGCIFDIWHIFLCRVTSNFTGVQRCENGMEELTVCG